MLGHVPASNGEPAISVSGPVVGSMLYTETFDGTEVGHLGELARRIHCHAEGIHPRRDGGN